MRLRQNWALQVVGTVTLAAGGCSSIPISGRESAASPPTPTASVSRVVVLWTEAVLRQNDLPVAQGFAGKVYLFGPESREPVTAPGIFTVYAYDETKKREEGAEPKSTKPDGSWEFKESDLRSLLKKDPVGWSYSLWVPYGPPVGSERRVNVRMSFTPENGHQILSESALITLPSVTPVGPARMGAARVSQKKAPESKDAIALAYRPIDELP